jgi:maltoporin
MSSASRPWKPTNHIGDRNGFNVGIREVFAEMKNVFKGAPEITFWGGQRFYDRYNIDPDDLFWLDSSGWGVGAYNIDLGFRQVVCGLARRV